MSINRLGPPIYRNSVYPAVRIRWGPEIRIAPYSIPRFSAPDNTITLPPPIHAPQALATHIWWHEVAHWAGAALCYAGKNYAVEEVIAELTALEFSGFQDTSYFEGWRRQISDNLDDLWGEVQERCDFLENWTDGRRK